MVFCRSAVLPLGLSLLSACGSSTPVQVRAAFQPGVPLRGLEIAALPFDVDALLDTLARAASTPRPSFPDIEEQIREYRPRPRDGRSVESDVTAAWLATRDSVARLSQSLSRMDRRAPAYRLAYDRFRELYGRYTARQAAREAGARRVFATDHALAARASRAADSLRAWERVAYRAFPELAAALAASRPVRRARTDSAGTTRFDLPAGRWWIEARLPDPDNPFRELHWNAPISVTAGLPFAVPLLRANARDRWRH